MQINEVSENYSQANQDLFVLKVLDFKRNGTYLEIGAYEPVSISNTYLLEKNYDWTGYSIELKQDLVDHFNRERKNICECADATLTDYRKILQENFTDTRLDYLSVDIEPASNTFAALASIPLSEYRFSVITYEHDSYMDGQTYKQEAKELLESHGYTLVVEDVKNVGNPFEDWYVDSTYVNEEKYLELKSSGLEYNEIIRLNK